MATTGLPHEAVAALASALADAGDRSEMAARSTRVVASLAGAARVSVVAYEPPGHPVPLGSSDARGMALIQWQVDRAQGPAVEVCRGSRAVVMPRIDALASRRWPGYTQQLRSAGVASLWCVPLPAGDRCVGAMEGHLDGAGSVERGTLVPVQALAAVVGVLLLRAGRRQRLSHLAVRLGRALDERVTVEQASGHVAERHRLTPREAAALLREHAQRQSRALHEVAGDVLAGRLRL